MFLLYLQAFNRKASSARPLVFTSAASLTCKAQQLANSAATCKYFITLREIEHRI